jgi:hypothetical protein
VFTIELVLQSQTFQIAWRSLAATYELSVENLRLLKKPYEVLPRASEAHFRLFLAVVEGR